jgi:hypothetical protein
VRPHLPDACIYQGSFREVITRYASHAGFAVAAAVAKTINLLETHDVGMLLRSGDEVCAAREHFDCAFNPAGFVDGVLEVRAQSLSFPSLFSCLTL